MSLFTFYLGICYLAELCIGQSITPAPTASCNYCFLAPGYTDVSSSSEEYLLFTAYSLTSTFAQDGFCFTVSGAPSQLPTPYSVAKPASATADPALYQSAVATWFVNFLDVPDWGACGENGSLAVHMADANANATALVNVTVPTILGAASPTSLAATSNTASLVGTQSSVVKPVSSGLSARAKAAVGLVVSVVGLGLVLPGLGLWYRYRKQRAARTERKIEEKLETEDETEMEGGGARGI